MAIHLLQNEFLMVGNQSATKAAKGYKKVQPFPNCYSLEKEFKHIQAKAEGYS